MTVQGVIIPLITPWTPKKWSTLTNMHDAIGFLLPCFFILLLRGFFVCVCKRSSKSVDTLVTSRCHRGTRERSWLEQPHVILTRVHFTCTEVKLHIRSENSFNICQDASSRTQNCQIEWATRCLRRGAPNSKVGKIQHINRKRQHLS